MMEQERPWTWKAPEASVDAKNYSTKSSEGKYMAKYLLFAFSDCVDPSREKEFNDWYDNMHVPDMLETPGMIRATRWVSASPKENQHRKYLALYELETDDVDEFDKKVQEIGMATVQRGRFSDLPVFDPPDVPRVYKQIMEAKEPKRPRKP
jgi:hypothetical protein